MNEQLVLRILAHIAFRFLHLLFLIESDVYTLLLRLFDKQKEESDVEIFNIFARFRFDFTDATSQSDFLIFHEKYTRFEEICEEGWYIYSITDRYIYLVKISPIEEDFFEGTVSIEKCSKLSNYLFQNGEKLARIPIEDFQRVTKPLPPFNSKVVVIHSAPSSGTTLAAKLLQACDNSKLSLLVIGEPPFLSHLSLCFNCCSIERMRSLCRSTLKFSLMHQKTQQTIVLKSRSSCTKIVPFIHAELPSIQHLFMTRKHRNETISRLVMYTSTNVPLFSLLCKFNQYFPWLSGILSNWNELEKEMMIRVAPKTDVEYAMAQVYGCVLNFRRNCRYFVMNLPFVEDLVSDTASSIKPLLDVCQISDLAIPECIEWKRNEEGRLNEVFDAVELNDVDSERVKQLVELIQQDIFML